jgi:hypothetical protein
LVSALELPVVVKNNSDLNKNSSMFQVNCHVGAPELSSLALLNCPWW